MNSKKLRDRFLSFFEKKGHKIVESSSLIPEDGSVLFTTAGMQQFKDYYVDKESPHGTKVTTAQKCFRTSDIDEVGDKDHLTFLEMLGNFSFGDYFKEESCKWALEFLTEECGIDINRLIFTYFQGSKDVPTDNKSKEIWESLGVREDQLRKLGEEDNFWGPTGDSGPCGPTTEIHYDITGKACGEGCNLDCGCGRYVEIWNLVFNQYFKNKKGNLTPLKKQGVDTGMGLERLAMIVQGKNDVFETDLFTSIREKIEFLANKSSVEEKPERIIADHVKGAVFLISEGITPSNTDKGYILRRLLRRAIRYEKILDLPKNTLKELAGVVFEIYGSIYLDDGEKDKVFEIMEKERKKFKKTLSKGLSEFKKVTKKGSLDGEKAFHLYSTYGFPLEMIEDLCEEEDIQFTREGFDLAKKRHVKASKKGVEKKFGGVGKDPQKEEIKLHTTTHLLHKALRLVLGDHVRQRGSDINSKRLRFDFSNPESMSEQEIEKVEQVVNKKIKADLERRVEEMSYDKAVAEGALSFFDKDKYPEKVKVYSFIDSDGNVFSKELCGGPHVKRTGELGDFKIKKEKSSGRGVRRIKAVLN